MLPGITPALFGGARPIVDAYTKSLMKFDGVANASANVANSPTLRDYVKPTRYWTTNGAGVKAYGAVWAGTSLYTDGSGVFSPPNDPDYDLVGDFTIDFWIFPNGLAAGFAGPILTRVNAASYGAFYFNQEGAAGAVKFYSSSNGTAWDIANVVSVGSLNASTSTHLAVQRSGNNWNTWQNGALVSSWSSALNPINIPVPVGYGTNSGINTISWGGYLDELRFSSIARYPVNASFTAPVSPHYGPLSGGNDSATKLLLHAEDLTDSAYGATLRTPHTLVSVGGASAVSTQAKFGSKSFSFNGVANNRITIANTGNDFYLGPGDFTIEFWAYWTGGSFTLLQNRDTSTQITPWVIGASDASGAVVMYASSNGSAWNLLVAFALGSLTMNQWVHFAVQKNSGQVRSFRNGVLVGGPTAMGPCLYNPAFPLSIGGLADFGGGSGFIDEIRISDVARFPVAGFTPPTAPYS